MSLTLPVAFLVTLGVTGVIVGVVDGIEWFRGRVRGRR